MARLGSELAGAAMAYASDKNDIELMSYVDFSYSDLRFANNNEAESRCKVILGEIKNRADELSGYLITNEDITQFESLISDYSDIKEDMYVTNTESVLATRNLKRLFSEVSKLLTLKMDAFVMRLKKQHPEFTQQYGKAREILGVPTFKSKDSEVETM